MPPSPSTVGGGSAWQNTVGGGSAWQNGSPTAVPSSGASSGELAGAVAVSESSPSSGGASGITNSSLVEVDVGASATSRANPSSATCVHREQSTEDGNLMAGRASEGAHWFVHRRAELDEQSEELFKTHL